MSLQICSATLASYHSAYMPALNSAALQT